ncbi:hypothetical protein TI03_00440 [Achromatium sp. WMS1]|nr:hypothetical protein TI03_00440 [Achromatium sp. WMS1]
MQLKVTIHYLALLPACLLMTSMLWAEEPRIPSISAVFTATTLTTNKSQITSDFLSSMDLVGVLPIGSGDLNVHVEGATTVGDNDVSAVIGESNGDAGSATDQDGNGRVQISELFYALPLLNKGSISFGMLDPTANLDTSDVANDETTQFLAGPLINNPTIAFPDYTIGLSLDAEPESMGFGYHLFLGSSHGLGDDINTSKYHRLLQLDQDGKGIFAAVEGVWKQHNLTTRFGVWLNSADNAHLDDADKTSKNYGFYGVLNGSMDTSTWGIRFGWSDPSVSEANWSLGAAVEHPVNGVGILGIGLTYTIASDNLQDDPDNDFMAANNMVAEIYLRLDKLTEHLQITPLVQYIDNSGYNSADTVPTDVWVFGTRFNVELP